MKAFFAAILILGVAYSEGALCFVPICASNPSNTKRGTDSFGSGAYEASRTGGRIHKGLDIKCDLDSIVYSPFPAKVIRLARPYGNGRPHDSGILMDGTGQWTGYSVKMFYFTKTAVDGTLISAGSCIGTMTNMAVEYGPGMTNHIHVQLYENNVIIDPTPYFC